MYFFDYIRDLVEAAFKDGNTIDQVVSKNYKGKQIVLTNTKYLLGQTIRQYQVDYDHWHISKEAYERLKKIGLSKKELLQYTYNANLSISGIEEKRCKFNKHFVVEHVIPINMIMNELNTVQQSGKLSDAKILEILDKIHICIVTKDENRRLNKGYRKTREGDFNFITRNPKGAYRMCDIDIKKKIPFDNKTKKLK